MYLFTADAGRLSQSTGFQHKDGVMAIVCITVLDYVLSLSVQKRLQNVIQAFAGLACCARMLACLVCFAVLYCAALAHLLTCFQGTKSNLARKRSMPCSNDFFD